MDNQPKDWQLAEQCNKHDRGKNQYTQRCGAQG